MELLALIADYLFGQENGMKASPPCSSTRYCLRKSFNRQKPIHLVLLIILSWKFGEWMKYQQPH